MRLPPLLVAFAILASPALAEPMEEAAFAGALRGCEVWVLDPASWTDGVEPFLAAIGLGAEVKEVASVPEGFLPPESLRQGSRHWRIGVTNAAAYMLTVSETLPMCHVVGAGRADFHPAAEAVLVSPAFAARWKRTGEKRDGGMVSTRLRSRRDPAFTMTVSRAGAPGGVQVIATAILDPHR